MPSVTSASPQGEGGQSQGWVKLDSQSINVVAFDRETNVLKVHYNKGDTWSYKDVPLQKYKKLVYASSSGAYLRNEIIPHHDAVKLHDGAPDELPESGT